MLLTLRIDYSVITMKIFVKTLNSVVYNKGFEVTNTVMTLVKTMTQNDTFLGFFKLFSELLVKAKIMLFKVSSPQFYSKNLKILL